MKNINISTYNLSEAQGLIIKDLLIKYPGLTVEEYCTILNISTRTFFRYQNRYDFQIINRVTTKHPTKDRTTKIFIKYTSRVKKSNIRMRIKSAKK